MIKNVNLKTFSFAVSLIIIQTAFFGYLSISEEPMIKENKSQLSEEEIIEIEPNENSRKMLPKEENQESLQVKKIEEPLEEEVQKPLEEEVQKPLEEEENQEPLEEEENNEPLEEEETYDNIWIESLPEIETEELKSFSSNDEFKEYVNISSYYPYYNNFYLTDSWDSPNIIAINSYSDAKSTDFSTTNIQVQGVDEADILKTDGEYIYVVTNGKVVIVKAYPSSELKVISEIITNNHIYEIFINYDKLVIFEYERVYFSINLKSIEFENITLETYEIYTDNLYYRYWQCYPSYYYKTNIKIYDITNKTNPVLTQKVSVTGNYIDSRMIGDYIYVITKQNIYCFNDNITMPIIENNNKTKVVNATEINYFNNSASKYSFTNILSVNLNSKQVYYNIYLLSSHDMYVSKGNIYLTYSRYINGNQTTIINRFTIYNGTIRYTGFGKVLGRVLNQFLMDEYNKYFRIATTFGWSQANNLYILDENLTIVGKIEGLAEGERIYSARFMKERCYLVTFRQIDPLFVIDLKNTTNPKVLGFLKIPGVSNYLHPYDKNHIIGIGRDATEEGRFQGIKMSLFDVSDVNNPKEKSKYLIGTRSTYSEALYDHKTFLFSKSKNLLSIPIRESKYFNNQYYHWQGACVFNLDLENGFVLKGNITHSEDESYYYSGSIRRILYIEDNLYTISNIMIKVNDLNNLEELGEIKF